MLFFSSDYVLSPEEAGSRALTGYKRSKPSDGVLGRKSTPIHDGFDEEAFERRHEDGEIDADTGLLKSSSRRTFDVIPEVAAHIAAGYFYQFNDESACQAIIVSNCFHGYIPLCCTAQKAGNRPLFKTKATPLCDATLDELLGRDFAEKELFTPQDIQDMKQEQKLHDQLYIPSSHNRIWPKPGNQSD